MFKYKKIFFKKIIALIMIFCLLSVYLPALSLISFAADNITTLATPTNLKWKDGSSATATWDAVENANYYHIIVNVYNENNELMGSENTGTSNNQIDLQQEINEINYNYKLNKMFVSFVVQAAYVENNTNITGDYSEESIKYFIEKNGSIKLPTPTNISLDDDYNATWDIDTTNFSNIKYFNIYYKIKYQDSVKTGYLGLFDPSSTPARDPKFGMTITDGKATANIKNKLATKYKELGYNGQTIEISYYVVSQADSNSSMYLDSNNSEYSNSTYYNSTGSTKINSITLSPNKPVIAVGRKIYIGKTIEPDNAYYDIINWSTSDNSIVSINNMGQITGVKKGNATITAQINNATQNADVSVYEIESNINNSAEATDVICEANDVIEAVITDGDISNTDITDKEAAINEIEQGAQNGDMFNVDIKYDNKTASDYENIKDKINSKFKDYNIVGGNDIKIAISHIDNNGAEHHIANITELENEVSVQFDMLSNVPELSETKTRDYKLIRCHNENVENIDFEINDGIIETKSNKFSDFVLLYKDTDKDANTEIGNIVKNIPKYYVFDMEKFQNQEINLAEYTSQQLKKYIEQIINDDSIEISVENLEGGGNVTFMEWSADVKIYKNGILYDTVHFGWEDNSNITIFALITVPSNIANTEAAFISYARNIIDQEWTYSPYKIEKYEQLKDKEIVLLETEKFGTIKYKGNDIASNIFAFTPIDDIETPEPLLLMQEVKDNDEIINIINNIPRYYVFDIDKLQSEDIDIVEYSCVQLKNYIKQLINDESFEIEIEAVCGAGSFNIYEWDADIKITKNGVLLDTLHFSWENGTQITMFGLITLPSNIEETETAYIAYAKDIIENTYNWTDSYSIEKYQQLNDKDIVLLDTNKFGTIKYKGQDIELNIFAFKTQDEERPEPLLIMKDNSAQEPEINIRDIVKNIPKYYVFDMEKFQNQEIDLAEYTSQQLKKYIEQIINDDSIEINVENLEGGGDFTFMEWMADVNIYRNGTLIDTVHFGWEDNSQITVFALITIPSNSEKTEEAFISYAKNEIDNKYNWPFPYKIEKYEQLEDKEIVLLETEKFGTIKYKGNDIASNIYAFIPIDDIEIPEPLLLMQEDIDSSTFSISGEITSYYSDTDNIQIQLFKEGRPEVMLEKNVNGNTTNYEFTNIENGNYIIKINKNNHVSREYSITVNNSNVTQNAHICLVGDINGDGKTNNKDWDRMYKHINDTSILTDYQLLCADVNKDGKVNNKDWNRLYNHINEIDLLY